jgi:glycosyltransferase involved in cell wall biosynthesis
VTVVLAGPHGGGLDHLRAEDVELKGFVPDLEPLYASASLVVVPLRTGAGTRIKLLEAFAHAVPVVASSVAAVGLEVVDGRHLLVADDPAPTVEAIERLLTQPELAQRIVDDAGRLVRERYSFEAVAPAIRAFFARAAAGRREPTLPARRAQGPARRDPSG